MSKTPGDPGLRWRDRPLDGGEPEDRAAFIIRRSLPARAPEDAVLARIERHVLAEPATSARSPLLFRLVLTALFLILGAASVKAYEYARRAGWIGPGASTVSPGNTASPERPRRAVKHGGAASRPGSGEPAPALVAVAEAKPVVDQIAPTVQLTPQPPARANPPRLALVEASGRRPSASPRGLASPPVAAAIPHEQPSAAPVPPTNVPSLQPASPPVAPARPTPVTAPDPSQRPGQRRLAVARPADQNPQGQWRGDSRLQPAAPAPQIVVPATNAPSIESPSARLQASPPPRSAAAEEARILDQALTLLRRQHDATGALATLDGYLRRHPNGLLNHEARVARVDALLLLHRSDDALVALEGLPLDGKRRANELRVIRAELRARTSCVSAEADFTTALVHSRDGQLIERILYGRGACRAKLGDRNGAAQDLRQYLERFPVGPHAAWAKQWLASFDGSPKSGG